jgi:hypothetical protein
VNRDRYGWSLDPSYVPFHFFPSAIPCALTDAGGGHAAKATTFLPENVCRPWKLPTGKLKTVFWLTGERIARFLQTVWGVLVMEMGAGD